MTETFSSNLVTEQLTRKAFDFYYGVLFLLKLGCLSL